MFKLGKNKKENKTIKQIKNWYQDRYETILIQRNVLFLLLTILTIVFSFSILSFVEMNKKKVYEPYVIQVEEQTGVITRVDSRAVKDLKVEEAIRNSILVRYINARETYHAADYAYNYNQIVRIISSPEVFQQFLSMVSAENPASPLHLDNRFKVAVKIKSLVDLTGKAPGGINISKNTNIVQIRVAKQKIALDRDIVVEEKNFIITLTYEYKDVDLSESARYINPIGLQINAYQIYEEPNASNL